MTPSPAPVRRFDAAWLADRGRWPTPQGDLLDDRLAGLLRHPKSPPCKWLYDEQDSELFERICRTLELSLSGLASVLAHRSCGSPNWAPPRLPLSAA